MLSQADLSPDLKPLIIGSGPVALFLAVKLAKVYGVEVTLVGDRVGQYTRPGSIGIAAFQLIAKELKMDLQEPSLAQHIKEIERSLYDMAKSLPNLKIIPASFIGLTSEQDVIIKHKSTEKEEVLSSFNLIFDGTGDKRAVIEKLQQFDSKEKDESQTRVIVSDVVENPIKDHMLAYVKMRRQDMVFLEQKTTKEQTLPTHFSYKDTLRMLKFRKETGWDCFDKPDLSVFHANPNKQKSMIYTETPKAALYDSKSIDEQKKMEQAYLDAVIKLYAEREVKFQKIDKPSKKYGDKSKQRWNRFKVQPKKLNSAFYIKGEKVFIPIGDAQSGIDYRLGIGVMSGVERVSLMLQSSTAIQNKQIKKINFSSLQYNMTCLVDLQNTKIARLYRFRKERINRANTLAHAAIVNEFMKAKSEDEQNKILAEIDFLPKEELDKIKQSIAKELEAKVELNLQSISLDQKQINNKAKNWFAIFLNNIQLLEKVLEIIPDKVNPQNEQIMATMLRITTMAINALDSSAKGALKQYQALWDISTKYFKSNLNLRLMIAVNQLSTCIENKKIMEGIDLANNILTELSKAPPVSIEEQKSEENVLIATLMYKKLMLLLNYNATLGKPGFFSLLAKKSQEGKANPKQLVAEADHIIETLLQYYPESLKLSKHELPLRGKASLQYQSLKDKIIDTDKAFPSIRGS